MHQTGSNILKLHSCADLHQQELLTLMPSTKWEMIEGFRKKPSDLSRFILLFVFSVPQRSGTRSSTTHSCAATLPSSIRAWVSSSSTMRTGPSSGRGFWRSYANVKTSTTEDSCSEDCNELQRSEEIQPEVIFSWTLGLFHVVYWLVQHFNFWSVNE